MSFLHRLLSTVSSGPLGALTWLGAGIVSWAVGRLLPFGRRGAWFEAALAILAAMMAGLGATALDFGGWRVVDWRSALFALLCSLASIAVARIASMARERRSDRTSSGPPGARKSPPSRARGA